MTVLRPNVNRGRQQLAGVLTRVLSSGLGPPAKWIVEQPGNPLGQPSDEVIADAVDLVLGALDGYLVVDRELIACSDEEILDAKAKLSAALRTALEIPVEAR